MIDVHWWSNMTIRADRDESCSSRGTGGEGIMQILYMMDRSVASIQSIRFGALANLSAKRDVAGGYQGKHTGDPC